MVFKKTVTTQACVLEDNMEDILERCADFSQGNDQKTILIN